MQVIATLERLGDFWLWHLRTSSQWSPQSNHHGMHLKRAALILTSSSVIMPPSFEADTQILGAIVIFNAALAHHLAAESQDIPTPPEALHKSHRLYRLSYQVCAGTQSILFQFAVLNNIGGRKKTWKYRFVQ